MIKHVNVVPTECTLVNRLGDVNVLGNCEGASWNESLGIRIIFIFYVRDLDNTWGNIFRGSF